ncbi:hypothetical protein J6590_079025 [Homalodisca vitripennis]|nr:hypothetical protein J6590_079025 [Homalodisca vitripennis]
MASHRVAAPTPNLTHPECAVTLNHCRTKCNEGLTRILFLSEQQSTQSGSQLFPSHVKFDQPGHRLPKFSLVHWGVCVPSVCSPGDVQEALRHVLGLRSEITTTVGVDPDLCHHDADPPTVPSLATISAW